MKYEKYKRNGVTVVDGTKIHTPPDFKEFPKLDSIHYDHFRYIESLDRVWNFVACGRDVGKTTLVAVRLYLTYLKGYTAILLTRYAADITEGYIQDIEREMNKFRGDLPGITFKYNMASAQDGYVDIYINDRLAFRIQNLNMNLTRIKRIKVPNLYAIIFDEFIVNERNGEKYLKKEVEKFNEILVTVNREAVNNRARIFMYGNPYSKHNPYFAYLKVSLGDLDPGNIVISDNYVIDLYTMQPELKEYLLKKNKDYKFDDDYLKFVMEGNSINDNNIVVVDNRPDYFELLRVFYINKTYIGVYANRGKIDIYNPGTLYYYVEELPDYSSTRRTIPCINIDDFREGTVLANGLREYEHIKFCFNKRKIGFKDANAYYNFYELYKYM